ncbi:MAG: hypothetical protein ABIG31_05245 [Candidatus Omnitrophota bacterium]
MIMAQWFKARYYSKDGLYSHLIDRKDLTNLTSKENWSKTPYFKEYQKSFKDGEYNIKEPVYTPYGQTIRSYFSGGEIFDLGRMPGLGEVVHNPKTGAVSSSIASRLPQSLNHNVIEIKVGATTMSSEIDKVELRPQEQTSIASSAVGESSDLSRREFLKQTRTLIKALAVGATFGFLGCGGSYEKSGENKKDSILQGVEFSLKELQDAVSNRLGSVSEEDLKTSINLSNQNETLVRQAYDYLMAENILSSSTSFVPVLFFLKGMNDDWGMAIFGDLELIVVGYDYYNNSEALPSQEARDAWLARMIAHEATHIKNHKENPGLAPLMDEYLAQEASYKAAKAMEPNKDTVENEKKAYEAFGVLVSESKRHEVVDLFGISVDDFIYLSYSGIVKPVTKEEIYAPTITITLFDKRNKARMIAVQVNVETSEIDLAGNRDGSDFSKETSGSPLEPESASSVMESGPVKASSAMGSTAARPLISVFGIYEDELLYAEAQVIEQMNEFHRRYLDIYRDAELSTVGLVRKEGNKDILVDLILPRRNKILYVETKLVERYMIGGFKEKVLRAIAESYDLRLEVNSQGRLTLISDKEGDSIIFSDQYDWGEAVAIISKLAPITLPENIVAVQRIITERGGLSLENDWDLIITDYSHARTMRYQMRVQKEVEQKKATPVFYFHYHPDGGLEFSDSDFRDWLENGFEWAGIGIPQKDGKTISYRLYYVPSLLSRQETRLYRLPFADNPVMRDIYYHTRGSYLFWQQAIKIYEAALTWNADAVNALQDTMKRMKAGEVLDRAEKEFQRSGTPESICSDYRFAVNVFFSTFTYKLDEIFKSKPLEGEKLKVAISQLEKMLLFMRMTEVLAREKGDGSIKNSPPLGNNPVSGSPLEPETASSAMEQRFGGIDFRSLPIVTQAMTNLSVNISSSAIRNLVSTNLDEEWRQIARMASSGITPSSERIKEYIQTSCAQESITQDRDKILFCISDILRSEEESCCSTDATLRDILVVLESMGSAQELREVFLGKG